MHTHEIIEIILTKVAKWYDCKWQDLVKPSTYNPDIRKARAAAIILMMRYEDFILNRQLVAQTFRVTEKTTSSLNKKWREIAEIKSWKFRTVEHDIYQTIIGVISNAA